VSAISIRGQGVAAIAARRGLCATTPRPRCRSRLSTAARSTPPARKRDTPNSAEKPVIIGGGKRGVVSAACYIARTFGVRSAMPMFKALALCPHATVIRPDMAKYVRVGREVRHAMQALTPLVEPLSIDEAFLDLAGTQRVHGMIPAKVLARFARDVERNIGITVSVGLSVNKFLAKIASDLDKPRGFAALDQD